MRGYSSVVMNLEDYVADFYHCSVGIAAKVEHQRHCMHRFGSLDRGLPECGGYVGFELDSFGKEEVVVVLNFFAVDNLVGLYKLDCRAPDLLVAFQGDFEVLSQVGICGCKVGVELNL